MSRPVVRERGSAARLLGLVALATVLAGCIFEPFLNHPEGGAETSIGYRSSVNSYGRESLRAEIVGFRDPDELPAIAETLTAAAFPAGDGSFTETRTYSGEPTTLKGRIDGVPVARLGVVVDSGAAARAARQMGIELVYLHWCPPRGYSIVDFAGAASDLEGFGCAVWETPGFESAHLRIGSVGRFVVPLQLLVAAVGYLAALAVAALALGRLKSGMRWVAPVGWLLSSFGWQFVSEERIPALATVAVVEPERYPFDPIPPWVFSIGPGLLGLVIIAVLLVWIVISQLARAARRVQK